ncbi:MAG: hypothetical protein M1840_008123 [Geoglossum simile]|nr:MAG: hypothetical protein M1840_008123 [Geoglossum simile]
MNSNTPAQAFSRENHIPIAVEMYIKDVEQMAESSGRDEVSREKLCRLIFYNGLRGAAQQWCSQLDPTIQRDWKLLKDAFLQRFSTQKEGGRNKGYLLDQIQALKQSNRAVTDYIKQAESFLARALINGITDSINQRIVISLLPRHGYAFEEVKDAVEKVYSYPSNNPSQD